MEEQEGNTDGDCLDNRGLGAEGVVLVDTGYPVHGVGLVQGSQKRWEKLQAVQVHRLGKTPLSWLPCLHHGGVASPGVPGNEQHLLVQGGGGLTCQTVGFQNHGQGTLM